MTDRELLEAAAKSAGIALVWIDGSDDFKDYCYIPRAVYPHNRRKDDGLTGEIWSPLTDDGDALRLAVKLKIEFYNGNDDGEATYAGYWTQTKMRYAIELHNKDPYAATRRAIVRAAAAMAQPTSPNDQVE